MMAERSFSTRDEKIDGKFWTEFLSLSSMVEIRSTVERTTQIESCFFLKSIFIQPFQKTQNHNMITIFCNNRNYVKKSRILERAGCSFQSTYSSCQTERKTIFLHINIHMLRKHLCMKHIIYSLSKISKSESVDNSNFFSYLVK